MPFVFVLGIIEFSNGTELTDTLCGPQSLLIVCEHLNLTTTLKTVNRRLKSHCIQEWRENNKKQLIILLLIQNRLCQVYPEHQPPTCQATCSDPAAMPGILFSRLVLQGQEALFPPVSFPGYNTPPHHAQTSSYRESINSIDYIVSDSSFSILSTGFLRLS